jgi:hypothetical protein
MIPLSQYRNPLPLVAALCTLLAIVTLAAVARRPRF